MTSTFIDEAEFRAWLGDGEVRRAATWLVRQFDDEVLGLCTAMVRDRSAAEDLAQDVFGKAFAALGAFRGEASARTWLLRIARNRCIDHLRAQHRDPWSGAGDDGDEPDLYPDDAPLPADLLGRRADVEDALDRLSEGERALVVLRFKNGLDYAELADAFGLKEGAVRMRVSRALAKMREALDQRDAREALDEIAAECAAPAPAAMPAGPPRAAGAAAPQRRRPSLRARLADALRGEAPVQLERPPATHPLTRYFAATRGGAGASLRERLIATATAL